MASAGVQVWTMRLDGLDEAGVAPWLDRLDPGERERAARFVFPRHRVQFVAAHALTRAVLARAIGAPPGALRFEAQPKGKPVAWLGEAPAPLSFNLSHTEGLVGVAVAALPGLDIGFDLEPAVRAASVDFLERHFQPVERDWLAGVDPAARPGEMLRLWCLREAFAKATGQGLGSDPAGFWFTARPTALHRPQAPPGRHWRFEDRRLDGDFIAALAVGCPDGQAVGSDWRSLGAGQLDGLVRA